MLGGRSIPIRAINKSRGEFVPCPVMIPLTMVLQAFWGIRCKMAGVARVLRVFAMSLEVLIQLNFVVILIVAP